MDLLQKVYKSEALAGVYKSEAPPESDVFIEF